MKRILLIISGFLKQIVPMDSKTDTVTGFKIRGDRGLLILCTAIATNRFQFRARDVLRLGLGSARYASSIGEGKFSFMLASSSSFDLKICTSLLTEKKIKSTRQSDSVRVRASTSEFPEIYVQYLIGKLSSGFR